MNFNILTLNVLSLNRMDNSVPVSELLEKDQNLLFLSLLSQAVSIEFSSHDCLPFDANGQRPYITKSL